MLNWPVRFVLGTVRHNDAVEDAEIPAFGWIIDVFRWSEALLRRGGIRQDVDDLLADPYKIANLDPADEAFPLLVWIRDRARLNLLRAQNNWNRWLRYINDLWIPGESGMDKPLIYLDIVRRMLYMVPHAQILSYHLEDGLPEGWGWRVVTQDVLQQVMADPDHVEVVLTGADDPVTIASLRRVQLEARKKSDDGSPVYIPGRLDALIKRVRQN